MSPAGGRRAHATSRLAGAGRALAAGVVLALAGAAAQGQAVDPQEPYALVVGAGLAGLSAAVEMGSQGVPVLVLDMNSVAGGHAVLAGGVTLVGTPVQERAGIADSPALAYEDWRDWTEDGDPDWTRRYAAESRRMIYDWATGLGVEFVRVAPAHGNSVPRFHFTRGRAVHLVLPIYRRALELASVSFRFNSRVDRLLLDDGRVVGVAFTDLRTGRTEEVRAARVVLATGGFENDLGRVLDNWTPGMPRPATLLSGASHAANGSGHDLAAAAGADFHWIDRHYIYVNGLPDPRDPTHRHALTAGNDLSLWVNRSGNRFTNETGFDKAILADLLLQDGSTYWAIFDSRSSNAFSVRGAAWLNNPGSAHPVLDDARVALRAGSLDDLAAQSGLPADNLAHSVGRFNALIESGNDSDFGRFSTHDDAPAPVAEPPYFAVQMFPMTRKNMGGVAVDGETRVLGRDGNPVEGLYAVGELNGSVGINGKHGLDGMFLGPAIFTGRVAGQSIAAGWNADRGKAPATILREFAHDADADAAPLTEATPAVLQGLLSLERDGYWHFKVSHRLVLERAYGCSDCHSARLPYAPLSSAAGFRTQTEVCTRCH